MLASTSFSAATAIVAEAIERGNAYLAAGADCVYPIDAPFDLVAALAAGIDGPVNVLVSPRDPPLAELARLGVARVTFGAGLARSHSARRRGLPLPRSRPGREA